MAWFYAAEWPTFAPPLTGVRQNTINRCPTDPDLGCDSGWAETAVLEAEYLGCLRAGRGLATLVFAREFGGFNPAASAFLD
jgi:hypothetical protein